MTMAVEKRAEQIRPNLRRALLAWYDRHARKLAWRVGPAERRAGVRPDPYRVWLSEVMLQQTTTVHAAPYFERFTIRWPTVGDLAAVEDAELMGAWAGLGYYARARNLLTCARAVARDHGGVFPDTEAALRALSGVGAYTAAAVAAIAFDRRSARRGGSPGRLGPSADGPGRHGLPPPPAAVRRLPGIGLVRGPRFGPTGAISSQVAQGRQASPHRRGLGDARSRGTGRSPSASRSGAAWRDVRSADIRVGRHS